MLLVTRITFSLLFILSFSFVLKGQGCEDFPEYSQNLKWNFVYTEENISAGDEFYAVCIVEGFDDVISFQYTIDYDPEVVRVLLVDDSESPLNGPLTYNPLFPGHVGILWTNILAEGQTLAPNTAIFEIQFEAVGNPGDCVEFELNSSFVDLEIAFIPYDFEVCAELISSNLCHGDLSFSVCGGEEPYGYTIGATDFSDQGVMDRSDTINYSGLKDAGLITISVVDNLGENVVLNLENEPQDTLKVFGEKLCNTYVTELYTYDFYDSYDWINPQGTKFSSNLNEPWIVNVIKPGLYTLTTSFDGCLQTTQFLLEDQDPPTLTQDNYTVCRDPANGNTTLILDSIIINGTGNYWSDFEMNFPIQQLDFEGLSYGSKLRTIFIEGIGPCGLELIQFRVEVIDCACDQINIVLEDDFCNDEVQVINLYDLLSDESPDTGEFTILTFEEELYSIQPDSDGNLTIDENFEEGGYFIRYEITTSDPSCPSMVDQAIRIYTPPEVQFISSDPICNLDTLGNSTILDLNEYITESSGYWQDSEGEVLSNTVIDFNGVVPGLYTFKFTTDDADEPCADLSFDYEIEVIDCLTSVTSTTSYPILNLFPNPSQGIYNIELNDKVEISIYDIHGRPIIQSSFNKGINAINIEGESKGIFILEIYQGGKLIGIEKIVKQ